MTTTEERREAPATPPPGGEVPAAPDATSRHRAGRLTVRTRILATILSLSALGLAVAGGTAWALQRERLDDSIDAELALNVAEFRALAEDGVDPADGLPFTRVQSLLYIGLQRTVPAENEGMLALVDGQVTWTAPSTVRLRLEQDGDLVAAARALSGETGVAIRSLTTADRTYRYVAVPVTVVGDPAEGLLLLAVDRGVEHAELARTFRTYALVSLVALLVTGLVGWVLAGRLLAPIRVLRRTAQQITDTDLSARIPVTGDDDLSDLTRTVNAMLERLDSAFTSQRRLLDDVGHELRTPLTIIRGHLELLDGSDPADVEQTRALVIDEVDRMHGLVDDLVTLATADRPDFVRPTPTDVAQLTDEVVDKARSLGGHRWRVERRAEVVADLDAQRITQALLQLAANAAKFAPEGSPIGVGSAVRGDRLVLTVRDQGPGVAPEDAERIFERFARAQVGRGVEGSGLGLPIVAAIAAAHGGTAYVERRRGPGACFVVDLPLRTTDEHTAPAPADIEEDAR